MLRRVFSAAAAVAIVVTATTGAAAVSSHRAVGVAVTHVAAPAAAAPYFPRLHAAYARAHLRHNVYAAKRAAVRRAATRTQLLAARRAAGLRAWRAAWRARSWRAHRYERRFVRFRRFHARRYVRRFARWRARRADSMAGASWRRITAFVAGAQASCMDAIIEVESGGNVHATNPSSGAYGIPQALPGSKMASAGADWAWNPVTQIRWMKRYCDEVYGSPCGALAHRQSHGWY